MKSRRIKDGYTHTCKTCISKQSRAYITKWEHERQKIQAMEQFELFPSFEKQCHHCKKILPITEFYTKKRSKDGHSHLCKTCDRQKAHESYQRRKHQPKTIPPQKTCHHCHKTKPSSDFTKSSINPDGLDHYCRTCKSHQQHAFRQKPGVAEKLYAAQKAYYHTPEGKKKQRSWARKYAQRPEVKAKRKAYHKEYSQRPEVIQHRKQYMKKYLQKKKQQKNLGTTKTEE
jgi:hypothetical protein